MESLPGAEDGVVGRKKGTECPECRREHRVLAGDPGWGQVNHSRELGLYSVEVSLWERVRCVFWEACLTLRRLRGQGRAARKIQMRGGYLNLHMDIGQYDI